MLDLLGERTIRDATTAVARGEENVAGSRDTAVVGEIGPIATHTCFTSVKQRRLGQVVGVVEPVPVWLVTLVAAFFAKRCLIRIGDVPMPSQEVALVCVVPVSVLKDP